METLGCRPHTVCFGEVREFSRSVLGCAGVVSAISKGAMPEQHFGDGKLELVAFTDSSAIGMVRCTSTAR